MSDEAEKSPAEVKPKREIRIGSQRTGSPADTPQNVSTAAPTPPPLQPAAETTVEPPADQTAGEPADDPKDAGMQGPAQDAESPTTTAEGVDTLAETDVARDEEVLPPQLDLNMSDDDLEQEIAQAMGEGVEDLMASQVRQQTDEFDLEIGSRYTGQVAKVYRDSVLIELSGQRNGVIPLRQFEEPPAAGTPLEVVATGFSVDDQMYDLALPGASVHVEDWGDLQEGAVVEAKITGDNKGGLECEVNQIRGFIPAREISVYRVEDFSTYVDQRLSCVVKEANESRRNLVLSHRAVMEREREEARQQLMEELAVGQTREGTVARLEKFGAFVDLGGVDGLVHISQLSWDRIRHPEEVLQVGQRIKVRVDKIDAENGRIGLSYRDLLYQPWDGIEAKYPVGDIVTGTVSKIMDFGGFVKLEPGVEGLVHISELSHQRVNRVSQVLEEGQQVEVKVLSVDAEEQKISLSVKAALAAPAIQDAAADADSDEPEAKHLPRIPIKSLKGGVERPSGGDQFGLKW